MFKAQYTAKTNFRAGSPMLQVESGHKVLSPQGRSTMGQKKSSVNDRDMAFQQKKLHQNLKKAYFEQLQNELDKRTEIITQQNQLLKKKKDLFNCYGPNALMNTSSALSKNQKQEFSVLI